MGQKRGGRVVVSILPTFNEAKVAKGGQQNLFVWQMKTGVKLPVLSMKKRNLLMLVVAKECIISVPLRSESCWRHGWGNNRNQRSVLQGVAWVNHSVRLQMLPTLVYSLIAGGYWEVPYQWQTDATEKAQKTCNLSSTLWKLLVWWKLTFKTQCLGIMLVWPHQQSVL